jgi:penicillin-binding protein 1A
MKLLLRFLGWLFALGTVMFLVGTVAVSVAIWHFSQDLPDYTQLQRYEPPVMTRVHAGDGSLLAEYATQRRLYLPIQAVPKLLIHAFLAAEDKNFYEHGGLDFSGILRAAWLYAQNIGTNRRPQGASTITQQVAKNFFLTNEVSFTRKIKEALLAMRLERTYSKDKILELYLNEIYLGMGAYGIAAASLTYFDKSVNELTLPEVAYLAALPKAPSTLNPFRSHERATERRNYVIDRMVDDGWATAAEGEKARKTPLDVVTRPAGAHLFAAEYFAEEVRREIYEKYGEKKLYEGGLSVRTTLDPRMQVAARKALADGLVHYDEAHGWRGPVAKIDVSGDWGVSLAKVKALNDIPWHLAVVLETSDRSARIGLQPGREGGGAVSKERTIGILPLDGVKWAKADSGPLKGKTPTKVSQVVHTGDVIYVEPLVREPPKNAARRRTSDRDEDTGPAPGNLFRLRQVPEVSGAIAVMDPNTGRVFALVGGFSYDQSQFNRATQAFRQPGSSFKPFVYAAALDNGYTPSSLVLDAPIEIDQGPGVGVWRPENYEKNFYGPSTLRFGIEHSRNVMTVRLAQDIGMPLIVEYAKRFGIYDDLPPYLSFALGAGETTVLKMVTGYSMFANGGHRINATLIDRIQDRYGKTIYKHDQRECRGCDADHWANQPEPTLIEKRDQVIDPMTAYQITSIMEGVVQRGTATVMRDVGRPVAGKTGTTNDWKDAWFIGYTPNLGVGVYIGYDKPRPLGRGVAATGGRLAAPVVRDFMKMALAGKPPVPFKEPPGIKLIRVDAHTGQRAGPGDTKVILEAFKPGTAPPDNYAVAGGGSADGQPYMVTPEADRAVRSGTGGLY